MPKNLLDGIKNNHFHSHYNYFILLPFKFKMHLVQFFDVKFNFFQKDKIYSIFIEKIIIIKI